MACRVGLDGDGRRTVRGASNGVLGRISTSRSGSRTCVGTVRQGQSRVAGVEALGAGAARYNSTVGYLPT